MTAGGRIWSALAIACAAGSAGVVAARQPLPVFAATATAELASDRAEARFVAYAEEPPPGGPPPAQDPASRGESPEERRAGVGMAEIMITARKREETVQTAPLSIRAFGDREIEERGLARISDLDLAVPNLLAEPTSNDNNMRIYIRGIGADDRIATVDPGVGVYIDGVYQARTYAQNFDLLDLERVEVLRGPQGTLYGRNTTGGTINLVTQKPTGEFGVKLRTEVGSFNRFNNSLAVSFPIVEEVLSGRVAFESKYNDGYFENEVNGDEQLSNDRSLNGRAQFNWIISENLETTLSFDRNYRRAHPQGSNPNSVCLTQSSVFCQFGLVQSVIAPLADGDTFEGNLNFGSDTIFPTNRADRRDNIVGNTGLTLTTTYDFGASQLKWIAGGRQIEQRETLDLDGGPLSYSEIIDHDFNTQLSQELQLNSSLLEDRLDLVAGVYYFREDNKNEQTLNIASDPRLQSNPLVALLSPVQSGESRNDQTVNTYAGYLNLSYDLTSQLTLDTGLRYSYDHKRFKRLDVRRNGVTFTDSRDTEHFSDLSPMVGLQYRYSDELQLFAKFSRAFRGGGFNGRANGLNPNTTSPFDPETVKVTEVGLKSSFLDDRVVFNLAGFYNLFDDVQLTTFTFDGTQFVSVVNNAGKARIVGLEAELFAQPIEGLLLTLGVGTIDAEYLTYREPSLVAGTTGFVDADNREFKNTPEFSASTSIAYTFDTFQDSQTTVRLDYSHRGDVFYNAVNNSAIAQDKIGLLNGRISWRSPSQTLELGLWGRNLTNREYDSFGFDLDASLGITTTYPAPPRELGFDVTLRY